MKSQEVKTLEKLKKLLERFKKAEDFFENPAISLEEKLGQAENFKSLTNQIDELSKRLKLSTNDLEKQMNEVGIRT